MTDKTHTPGPWAIVTEYGDTHITSADGQSLMCNMTYYPWVPEKIEDWNLIAAAPELLSALEMAVFWLEFEGKYDVNGMKYAIAKAKGQTK